jgi:hypothetical protein
MWLRSATSFMFWPAWAVTAIGERSAPIMRYRDVRIEPRQRDLDVVCPISISQHWCCRIGGLSRECVKEVTVQRSAREYGFRETSSDDESVHCDCSSWATLVDRHIVAKFSIERMAVSVERASHRLVVQWLIWRLQERLRRLCPRGVTARMQ